MHRAPPQAAPGAAARAAAPAGGANRSTIRPARGNPVTGSIPGSPSRPDQWSARPPLPPAPLSEIVRTLVVHPEKISARLLLDVVKVFQHDAADRGLNSLERLYRYAGDALKASIDVWEIDAEAMDSDSAEQFSAMHQYAALRYLEEAGQVLARAQ